MNQNEQALFVVELANIVTNEILAQIEAGKTPPTWDGNELRALLADRFEIAARYSCIIKTPRSARARDYRNHTRINAL